MSRKLTIIACSIVALVGCREDPGDPNYPVYEAVGATDPNFLPGPFPFQEGDERLSVGVFYEGGASEVIEIDNVSNNYFIYEGTYEQFPSEDRVEGLVSEQLVMTNAQLWFGGGVNWAAAQDLSAWTTLRVSLKATDPAFNSMNVQMEDGAVGIPAAASAYGFKADGEWHSIAIPLTAFAGVDLENVTIPVSFLGGSGPTDAVLQIDDLYFTKE